MAKKKDTSDLMRDLVKMAGHVVKYLYRKNSGNYACM